MPFPRNAGFGRCYLVSTRHEILSNIDRNAKPNRNSAAAPKKPKRNKSRESTDPIPVLLLSLESQIVVFQPSDFHLRKFKKFIIEKFYFHNHAPESRKAGKQLFENLTTAIKLGRDLYSRRICFI